MSDMFFLLGGDAGDVSPPVFTAGLNCPASGSTWVGLQWTVTDNVGIVSLVLSYTIVSSGVFTYITLDPSAPSWTTVSGLTPSTSYQFGITATDAAGYSASSTAYRPTTAPLPEDTTKPSQVTGLATYLIGGNSLTLGWNAATDNVGVYGYLLQYSLNNSTWVDVGTTSASVRELAHNGLTSYVLYYYRVRAFDLAGNQGDWSVTHSQRTSDNIKPVNSVEIAVGTKTNTTIPITWAFTDNVAVTSQTLYWKKSTSISYSTIALSSSATSYTLTGLTYLAYYEMYIVAWDLAGNFGLTYPLYEQATVATDTIPPTFPTQLYVSAYTTNYINYAWISADNIGVVSQDFWSRAYINGSWTSWWSYPLAANDVGEHHQGLTVGTQYEVFIRAKDAAGNSTDSNHVLQYTAFPP